LDGEEKTNLPMPKELALGTLIKIFAWLMGVYNIKDIF
jgi:hypothetical protein